MRTCIDQLFCEGNSVFVANLKKNKFKLLLTIPVSTPNTNVFPYKHTQVIVASRTSLVLNNFFAYLDPLSSIMTSIYSLSIKLSTLSIKILNYNLIIKCVQMIYIEL